MTKKQPLPPLTPKEKRVLEFIEEHTLSSGVSPSYQEIMDNFGLASFNSVQNYLKQLTTKGYIDNPSGMKRAIRILHSANSVVENLKQVSTKTGSPRLQLLQARDEVLSLPLLGKVAAGQPIENLKHDEFVEVPPNMVKKPNHSFALKVQGESMIDDGIWDEDIILVQQQNNAKNGDIIVATVDNEATVKRIYYKPHPSTKEPMIELRPSNSKMKSMWYHPEDVQIRGILVGLIRKY